MPDLDNRCPAELSRLRAEVKRLRAKIKLLTPGLGPLLKRRGFTIYKKEPGDDLFVPAKRHVAGYYRMLHRYSFRLFLRDVIKHQDELTLQNVTRYATLDVTRSYLDYLLSIRLLRKTKQGYVPAKKPIRSFGVTLEWYVAELLAREFGCEAAWGVKFRRRNVGGDYDVIAKYDGSLLYAEVKSSPPKQIYDSEIAAFLDRVSDLSPEIAIFLMDTELRMKDKIVPMFEKTLAERFEQPPAVVRIERELFQVEERIFIINSREDMLQNIQTVLSWRYRREQATGESRGPSDEARAG